MFMRRLFLIFTPALPRSYTDITIQKGGKYIMINNLIRQRMQGYLRQAELFGDMRRVWMKHVWWTREVINAIIYDLPTQSTSTAKLLQNPAEMAAIWGEYWDSAATRRVQDLFTTHLKQGGEIVAAAKAGQTQKVEELTRLWYQNSDDIARALSTINPRYSYEEVRRMMYEHLRLTLLEATSILHGNFNQSITAFDQIQDEAEQMADYFSKGLIAQNEHRFR